MLSFRPVTASVHRFLAILAVVLVAATPLWAQLAELASEARGAMDVDADNYEFDIESGLTTARGNVHIEYRGMILEAQEAKINLKTKDVEANGDIYFYTLDDPDSGRGDRGIFWHGEQLSGNFDTREFTTGRHKVTTGEWYETGERAEYHSTGEIVFHDVDLSTCEYLHIHAAHYRMHAKKVVYTPEGKVKAYHTVYKIGNVPVMYWPYVVWDTNRDGGNIEIRPGYDSDWGAYLLLSRSWDIGKKGETEMHLDLRSKRGVAVGNETRYRTENTDTEFLIYGMHDLAPPETTDGFNRRFESEEDRYRLKLYHKRNFNDELTLRLNLDAMSDIDFLEEWYEDDYEAYRQPRSYADLRYDHERFTAAVSVRPRVNDFYTVVEKLPELRLDFPRQRLGDSHIFYQGETSLAHLEMKWRDFDVPRPGGLADPADYDAWRLDSLHMFYRPMHFRNDLNVIPRAGLRLTWYSDSSRTDMTSGNLINLFALDDPDRLGSKTPITNYDDDGGSALRMAGEVGLEMSTKFYRVWDQAKSEFWQVDGLRHMVQPFINYTYISDPTEDRDNLYFFDNIDRLVKQNFVRVGVNQRLQTRAPGGYTIHTLASMETYADFHFETTGDRDTLGQFVNRVQLNPRPNFNLSSLLVINMDRPDLDRFELRGTYGDPNVLRTALGYLYRRDYESELLMSMGSSLADYTGENQAPLRFDENHYVTLTFDFPIGRKMSGYVRYEYDLKQTEMARQIYQLTRDLHCWMGALRLEEDDGVVSVQVILWLKAFPRIGSGVRM